MTALRKKRALALACATAAMAYTGCGASGGSSTVDDTVAKAVPADAPIYFEGSVRPTGAQADAIKSIAAKFPGGGDISALIASQLDQSLNKNNKPGSPTFSFKTDVDPWLGQRAGFFFSNLKNSPDGAGVFEVTDENAAKAFVQKAAAADPKQVAPTTQDGVQIFQSSGNSAVAVDNGLLFAGTPPGVKEAITTEKGSSNITGSSGFNDAVNRVDGSGALAFFYLDIGPTIDDAIRDQSPSNTTTADQVNQVLDATGIDRTKQFSFSLTPSGDEVKAKVAAPLSTGGDNSADILAQLPADAVAASGTGNFGDVLSKSIDAGLQAAAKGGAAGASVTRDQITTFLGIDPTEIGSALGGAAFYVSGTNTQNLRVGMLANVKDKSKIEQVVGNVQTLLSNVPSVTTADISVPGATTAFSITDPRQIPVPIEVALTDKQLFIGGGSGSAAAALSGGQTLGSSPQVSQLQSSLGGDKPSIFFDVPKLLALLQGVGATTGPGYQKAVPFLTPLGQFAAGGGSASDGYVVSNAVMTFSK